MATESLPENGSLIVRASAANVAATRSLRILLANPFVILGIIVSFVGSMQGALGGNAPLLWLLVFGTLGAAAIGVHYRLALANVTLYVGDGNLGSTDFLGRTRAISLSDAGALQLCSVTYNGGATIQPYPLGLSRDKRCIFSIPSADHFSIRDINRVANLAGVPVLGSWDDVVPLGELNRRFPGALSVIGRWIAGDWKHPRLTSVLILAMLIGLIVMVVVAVVAKSRGLI